MGKLDGHGTSLCNAIPFVDKPLICGKCKKCKYNNTMWCSKYKRWCRLVVAKCDEVI